MSLMTAGGRENQADGTWHTLYAEISLKPMAFYDIVPGSTKLKVTGCSIMNVSLPMFEIELPRDARYFNFEAPILAIYNEAGGILKAKAPNYNW